MAAALRGLLRELAPQLPELPPHLPRLVGRQGGEDLVDVVARPLDRHDAEAVVDAVADDLLEGIHVSPSPQTRAAVST